MKNSLLTLTCLFSFLITNAQSNYVEAWDDESLIVKLSAKKTVHIEGTPYIKEKFQPITITGQDSVRSFLGRYNGFNGDMEVQDNKGDVFVLNKLMTNYDVNFIAERKVYRSYKHKSEDDTLTNSFFVKLSDNNGMSLLKKENVKFFKEIKAVSSYDQPRPANYRRLDDQYFIKIDEDVPVEFSTKKKDIAKLFPEKSKDIIGYIKSSKLDTKDETDLITLINYISNL